MRLIRVKQGDAVRLRWSTDRPIALHLHGYDIETKVEPGAVAEMTFTARATGRFPVEEHKPQRRRRPHAWEPPLVQRRGSVRASATCVALHARCCRSGMAVLAARTPASAHGFGQRYELPLPLSLYLYGPRRPSLSLSFVVFGLFVRRAPAPRRPAGRSARLSPVGRILAPSRCLLALRLRVAACSSSPCGRPLRRPEPLPQHRADPGVDRLWVGRRLRFGVRRRHLGADQSMADVFDAAAMALPAARRRDANCRSPALPRRRSASGPRVVLLLAFSWTELVYPEPGRAGAHRVAWQSAIRCSPGSACCCSAATSGCGTARCSRSCSALSPVSRRPKRARAGDRLLAAAVRRGLLDDRPVSTSMMAFVLLLLATVLYDGLLGTGEWAS